MPVAGSTTESLGHPIGDIDLKTIPGLLSVTFMNGVRVRPNYRGIRVPRLSGRGRAGISLLTHGAVVILAVAVCTASLYAGQPKVKRHDNRHEIEQLEEAWRAAVLKTDTTALGNLLAEDYIAITASGTLQTKEEALANLRSGRVHIESIDFSDRKLRFYGNTALVTSLASVKASNNENEVTGSYRYTRVYVMGPQGKWKIVSFEASRIRYPGDHR